MYSQRKVNTTRQAAATAPNAVCGLVPDAESAAAEVQAAESPAVAKAASKAELHAIETAAVVRAAEEAADRKSVV